MSNRGSQQYLVKPKDGLATFYVRARNETEAGVKARRKLDGWTPRPRPVGFDLKPVRSRVAERFLSGYQD